jgi:hypothetical protein
VTGVWSKRIAEAHERNGTQPGAGLGAASVMLIAVAGLGFRLKLQLLRTFAREAMDIVLGGSWSTPRQRPRADDWRKTYQQQQGGHSYRQRAEGYSRWQQRTAADGDASSVLEQHRRCLGVDRRCTRAQLKAAYYQKAKLYHPDLSSASGGGASSRVTSSSEDFNKLKMAYDALLTCTPK